MSYPDKPKSQTASPHAPENPDAAYANSQRPPETPKPSAETVPQSQYPLVAPERYHIAAFSCAERFPYETLPARVSQSNSKLNTVRFRNAQSHNRSQRRPNNPQANSSPSLAIAYT